VEAEKGGKEVLVSVAATSGTTHLMQGKEGGRDGEEGLQHLIKAKKAVTKCLLPAPSPFMIVHHSYALHTR
jgi:hypothetical protein